MHHLLHGELTPHAAARRDVIAHRVCDAFHLITGECFRQKRGEVIGRRDRQHRIAADLTAGQNGLKDVVPKRSALFRKLRGQRIGDLHAGVVDRLQMYARHAGADQFVPQRVVRVARRGGTDADDMQEALEDLGIDAEVERQNGNAIRVERGREFLRVFSGEFLFSVIQTVGGDTKCDVARRSAKFIETLLRLLERSGERRMSARIRRQIFPGERQRADKVRGRIAGDGHDREILPVIVHISLGKLLSRVEVG